jgi:hypothetical protein
MSSPDTRQSRAVFHNVWTRTRATIPGGLTESIFAFVMHASKLTTRADVLKCASADTLKEAAKIVRGLCAGLTVSEREAVAEQAVTEIRNRPTIMEP